MIARLRAPTIAVILGAAILVLVTFGVLQRTAFPDWGRANLDAETSIATYFSASLLWTAAASWLLVAVFVQPRARSLWIWWPVIAWLALDEGAAIHERLEKWSGIDWQILYLPILAFAALAWWGVIRRYQGQASIDRLLVAGAIAWAAALLLELIQNWGGEPVTAVIYNPAMIIEEGLEMVGSMVFLIAALLAIRPAVPADLKQPS